MSVISHSYTLKITTGITYTIKYLFSTITNMKITYDDNKFQVLQIYQNLMTLRKLQIASWNGNAFKVCQLFAKYLMHLNIAKLFFLRIPYITLSNMIYQCWITRINLKWQLDLNGNTNEMNLEILVNTLMNGLNAKQKWAGGTIIKYSIACFECQK